MGLKMHDKQRGLTLCSLLGHSVSQRKISSFSHYFGRTLILIQHLVNDSSPREKTLESLMKIIRKVVGGFSSIAYFHVLLGLNKDVDLCANEGCRLRLADLKINGLIRPSHIPLS